MTDRDDHKDRGQAGPNEGLPDDLAGLHRELEALRIQERASFAPELRAELETAWEEEGSHLRRRTPRPVRVPGLLAASLGGLLLLGFSAPQARAALADFVGGVRESLAELIRPEAESDRTPLPRIPAVNAVDVRFPDPAPSDVAPDERPPTSADPEEPESGVEAVPEVAVVFPDLLDRDESSRLVQTFYPGELEGRPVGGTVGLRMYVDSTGSVGRVRLVRSSGVAALDAAAVRAAPSLRFRPAWKGSSPVGTWVELGIDFSAEPGPDAEGSASPNR